MPIEPAPAVEDAVGLAVTGDAQAMQIALAQARKAQAVGEVPVGAVVVHRGRVIAVGHNHPVGAHDPTAHAEIVALRTAALALGNYRLEDCALYVTLEPCAMCAGAILNARVRRLVFGAADPRGGAAGSVIDLFSSAGTTHHVEVQSGVLAAECAALLRDFFRARRINPEPLRDDALRTADHAFSGLPDYPWPPHYTCDLPALDGLRLHWVEAGPADAPRSWLCLHASPLWSYVWRHAIARFAQAGDRVLAPDLIGFGKSDKPKRESAHQPGWHREVLRQWMERVGVQRGVLLAHANACALGRSLVTAAAGRFDGVVLIAPSRAPALPATALSSPRLAAYRAPFPDAGHRSGIRALAEGAKAGPLDACQAALHDAMSGSESAKWHGRCLIVVDPQERENAPIGAPPDGAADAASTKITELRGAAAATDEEWGGRVAQVALDWLHAGA